MYGHQLQKHRHLRSAFLRSSEARPEDQRGLDRRRWDRLEGPPGRSRGRNDPRCHRAGAGGGRMIGAPHAYKVTIEVEVLQRGPIDSEKIDMLVTQAHNAVAKNVEV